MRYQLPWLLMVVLLASIIVAAPLQFAMQAPHPPSLNVHQGDDISSLLQEMAQSLNYGLPDGWEQLMYPPNTTGSYGIEPAYPSALRPVIETWRLDDEICEDALRDTHELVETAITDGVFLAQGFVYNTPMTSKVPSLVSLATLVVVAQIQYLVGTEVVQVQLGHLYMTSHRPRSQRGAIHVRSLAYGDLDVEPVTIDSKKITLTIWDTVGTELYRAVAPLVLRNAVGALLVYDVTRSKTPCLFSRKSFGDLSYWLDAVRLHSGIDTAVVVVGNKSDLDICRCISAEQGEAFAKTHGLPFAETSTARNEGTEEVFEEVALGAYDTMLARIERRKRDQTHTVHPFDLNNEARGACCSL